VSKPRVLFVGGKAVGIPDELRDRFEVVKHVSNEMGGRKDNYSLIRVDYVFVIIHFADHGLIAKVKKQVDAPVVYLPKGWPRMKQRLEQLRVLSPSDSSGKRCAYLPCSRLEGRDKPFPFGPWCCRMCMNVAHRKSLVSVPAHR
jgi:hypothetical protein